MKKIETLIELSRKATENSDYTDTTGIGQDEFIQYFSDAIRRIESVVNNKFPKNFLKEKVISLSPGAESVDIPVDVYNGTRVSTVEFSINAIGNSGFYVLKKGSLQERFSGITGNPVFYIPEGKKLLLKPGSQGIGRIRLTYQKAQPAADIRRGVISSVTVASDVLSAIQLDAASSTTVLDADGLNAQEYMTIIGRDGVVKVANIAINSVDANTGIVNMFASKTLDSDETTPAIGDFVCAGPYSSNICLMPDNVERYLLAYVNLKIFMRDSNVDSAEANAELKMLEEDIVATFADPEGDVDYVSVIDTQFVGVDDYGAWF
jgi:hypothetical protein